MLASPLHSRHDNAERSPRCNLINFGIWENEIYRARTYHVVASSAFVDVKKITVFLEGFGYSLPE